ncbi:MAG: hypothetical protein HY520_05065 [Candidatus Aenigmarchaeota archaeon]|nr:hypothetical protein [Candidatus Aenigmarchaeota archaeon]
MVFKEPAGKRYIASCPLLDVVARALPVKLANIRDAVALCLEDPHTEKPSKGALESFRSGA